VVEVKGDGVAKGGELVSGSLWQGAFFEELKELDKGVGESEGEVVGVGSGQVGFK